MSPLKYAGRPLDNVQRSPATRCTCPDRRMSTRPSTPAPAPSAMKPSPTAPVLPDYGPAICRGFFDSYRDQTAGLLILRAGRQANRGAAAARRRRRRRETGRQAGRAAASRVFGGNTPDDAFHRVLRGIDEGDRPSSTRSSRPRSAPPPATPRPIWPTIWVSSPATAPWPAPRRLTRTLSPTASGTKPSGSPASTSARTRELPRPKENAPESRTGNNAVLRRPVSR
jgi:hypothetical protein